MQLGDLARRARLVRHGGNGRVDRRRAHRRLLARALLGDDRCASLAAAASGSFVDSLDRREELRIDWLDARSIDGLNGALDLTLIDLFEHVQRRV